MRLIFLGPPGSGKGTQAKLLAQRLGLCYFSTGDILREARHRGTPEGRRAESYLVAGQLVPDELVNDIVKARLRAEDCAASFVIDGYPRNVGQAIAFDAMLREQNLELDGVVSLQADDQEIITRISARWSCPNPTCQATYNTLARPSRRAGVCDDCQTPLVQREDDRAETVRQRLKVYHEQTEDLIAYYRKRKLLIDVPGVGDIESIYRNIVGALSKSSTSH
jgi:adenylate kinase